MHTPILTVQTSNAPTPAPKAAPAAGAAERDFQRALTQQIEQRQAGEHTQQRQTEQRQAESRQAESRPAAPAPAEAPRAPEPQPAAAPKRADAAAAKAPQKQPAAPEQPAGPAKSAEPAAASTSADGQAQDASADTEDDSASEAAQAALAAPAVDMLALVASLNPGIALRAVAAAAGEASDALAKRGQRVGAASAQAPAMASEGEAKPVAGGAAGAELTLAAQTGADASPAGLKTPFALEAKAAAQDDAQRASARPAALRAEAAAQQTPNPAPAAPQLEAAQLAALAVREHAAAPRAHEAAPEASAVTAPVQQASLQIVQAASALPTDKLSGRVGTPAWDQQLGQKIVWMAAGGEQSATLTLNPPDLGPLQVVLNVSGTSTDASFTSAQPEVRQALEAALPRLREMMSEAGIELGQASVSSDTGGQRDGGAGQSGRGGARGNGAAGAQSADGAAARASALPRGLLGAVDTFA